MTPGRNDPCPCGSGRKYKKCHLAEDAAQSARPVSEEASPYHALDERVVSRLASYASRRFPEEFLDVAEMLEEYPDMTVQLGAPWLVYVAPFSGRPIVDWFLQEEGPMLSRNMREWLEWQQRSWLSIWEVVGVRPGEGFDLRDVLTGEQRRVHEVSASRTAKEHLMFLGRVVDAAEESLICGMHPNPLRPGQASAVVESVRKLLRRKTAVSPDRLRDGRVVWRMLDEWEFAIERSSEAPRLQNTDGDPLLLTKDRWKFDPETRAEVVERIAGIEGAQPQDSDSGAFFAIVREGNPIHRDWDNTVIATVEVRVSTVVAETNSVARADAIRAEIERACGSLVFQHRRSHTDPVSPRARAGADFEPDAPTPEEQAVLREFKERHYANWLDDRLPALDGRTPREAAKTRSGRERLTLILADMQLAEASMPEGERYDVSKLRRTLGLK